jgi:hypothetical protein
LTLEAGVTVIPVSPFYASAPERRIVRLCFAKSDETLARGAERLCELTWSSRSHKRPAARSSSKGCAVEGLEALD